MKRALTSFVLAIYFFGTMCLQMGSMVNDIPEMYRHCKATEDKDMTAFDFITDHLVNIDGLFDKHDNGDEQKPHNPIQNHHQGQVIVFVITDLAFTLKAFYSTESKPAILADNSLPTGYGTKIFRPPILRLDVNTQ